MQLPKQALPLLAVVGIKLFGIDLEPYGTLLLGVCRPPCLTEEGRHSHSQQPG